MTTMVCNESEALTRDETPPFEWRRVDIKALPFLGSLHSLFDDDIDIFVSADIAAITRTSLDGTWFLRGTINSIPLALVWNDFRVGGASTSKNIATTYIAFLAALAREPRPLFICVRTMGVRFMEGRTVFPFAFSVLPALNRYRKHHLVITLAHGNALGLGTLLFGMGHYRIAVNKDSCLNLTGPEVCKMVFGKQVSFEQIASNETQFKNTGLIHELCGTLEDAFARLPALLNFFHASGDNKDCHPRGISLHRADEYIGSFCDDHSELFKGFDDRLKVYIGVIDARPFGILINPPENPNNMIRARSLTLLEDALTLFERLQLPVVSLTDTPGADPRTDGNNRPIIEKLISASQKIIEYPYHKLGIVIGCAYGGASIIGFPKFFGSEAVYALENAHVGIMHESIITQLLAGSARLSALWQEVSATQTADLQDLIEAGQIDGIIGKQDIRGKIVHHLLGKRGNLVAVPNRRITDVQGTHRPMTHRHPLHGKPGNPLH